ncbi:hypothetical protein [Cohnella hongkongensis]|uniref:Transmembrane protein n=1 Tax=Cohnella hongkongensis TaxID=178337 RepID=A0ABV9FIE2_9BACL
MFSNRNGRDIRVRVAVFAGIAAGMLLIGLIMIPPVIGLADSGDFGRVLGVSGLRVLHPEQSYEELYFNYAHSYFGYGDFTLGGYVSTHVLFVAAAGWIGRLIDGSVFDIRILGACYAAFYIWAIALFVRHSPRMKGQAKTLCMAAVLAGALLFVFSDIGYAAYFQSFFGEPYALIAMLLLVASAFALASSEEPSGRMFALFVAAALAVATSKIQNAPLGFVFALLAWRMIRLRKDRRWQRQVWTGVAVLLVGSALMLVAAPDRLKHVNLYQSIFFGVLRDTPHLERDMAELGIPEKYKALAGTNYFQKDTAIPQNDPVLHREVLQQLSHKDIAIYYLKHPSRFMQKLDRAAENAMYIRPYYLGNYDASAGKPPGAISHSFGGWSEFKVYAMPRSAIGYFLIFLAYAITLAAIWRSSRSGAWRLRVETLSVVAVAGAFSCVVPLVGDGEADLGKHLFMFNVCFDMMVVSVIAGAFYGAMKLAERQVRSRA